MKSNNEYQIIVPRKILVHLLFWRGEKILFQKLQLGSILHIQKMRILLSLFHHFLQGCSICLCCCPCSHHVLLFLVVVRVGEEGHLGYIYRQDLAAFLLIYWDQLSLQVFFLRILTHLFHWDLFIDCFQERSLAWPICRYHQLL